MGQDNFRKCSMCHHFSEIFQCVINSQTGTQTLLFFVKSQKYFKNGKYRTIISQA